MANFKHELKELYAITDDMVREYQSADTTKYERGCIVADLLDITEELIKNNCKGFIKRYNATEVEEENLQSIACGVSLVHALNLFNFDRGVHFLTLWNKIQQRAFINEFKRCTTGKEKFHQFDCCSSDYKIDSEGNTILEYKEGSSDITEDVVGVVTLLDMVKRFDYECTNHRAGKRSLHGKIIKILSNESKQVQKAGLRKILGEEATDESIRQDISRARKSFKEFLEEQHYYI